MKGKPQNKRRKLQPDLSGFDVCTGFDILAKLQTERERAKKQK